MLIPLRAPKIYRERLYRALDGAKSHYNIERPGLADSIVNSLGSTMFQAGWTACVDAMNEELGKLDTGVNNDKPKPT